MDHNANNKALFDAADQFIAMANAISQSDSSGLAGTAIRYAAARYSAFEASRMSPDLSADKAKMRELFTKEFHKMMDIHLDAYIDHLAAQKSPKA